MTITENGFIYDENGKLLGRIPQTEREFEELMCTTEPD